MSIIKKGSFVSFAFLCFGVLAQDAYAIEGVDCKIAETAIRSASRIRSLKKKRDVPCKLQNREEVERYLLDTIEESLPADRLAKEGLVNQMLGIIPPDFKYAEGLIELYTSQIGGYYDSKKEYYAMAAWMPAMMQMPVAVHELTHALQDQHFKLDELIDHKTQLSDALLARSALIEGDATAVMIDYSRLLVGQGPLSKEESVSMFMIQNITGAMLSSSMSQAPVALQSTLIFPYVSGLRFAHELLKNGGYERIDKAFTRLPRSTEEILHPKKYFVEEADFIDVPIPKPPEGISVESDSAVFVDQLGEFIISSLLSTFRSPLEASEAAAGWGGDKLALYYVKEEGEYLLVWDLRWDTPKDAREFFESLSRAYAKRHGTEFVEGVERQTFIDPKFGAVAISIDDKKVVLSIGG